MCKKIIFLINKFPFLVRVSMVLVGDIEEKGFQQQSVKVCPPFVRLYFREQRGNRHPQSLAELIRIKDQILLGTIAAFLDGPADIFQAG